MRLLVSGPIGDHGIAVMLAREQFGLRGDLQSDAASVLPITLELARFPGLRFMRDPTRGGLATVAHEIVQASGLGVLLDETQRAGARRRALGVRNARLRPVFPGVRRTRRRRRCGRSGGCGARGRCVRCRARATRRSSATCASSRSAWSCARRSAASASSKNWRTIRCPASVDAGGVSVFSV